VRSLRQRLRRRNAHQSESFSSCLLAPPFSHQKPAANCFKHGEAMNTTSATSRLRSKRLSLSRRPCKKFYYWLSPPPLRVAELLMKPSPTRVIPCAEILHKLLVPGSMSTPGRAAIRPAAGERSGRNGKKDNATNKVRPRQFYYFFFILPAVGGRPHANCLPPIEPYHFH